MTEPKAWHCPNCNAYHAPHVDTCPKPKPMVANAATIRDYDELLRSGNQALNNAAGQSLNYCNPLRAEPNQQ